MDHASCMVGMRDRTVPDAMRAPSPIALAGLAARAHREMAACLCFSAGTELCVSGGVRPYAHPRTFRTVRLTNGETLRTFQIPRNHALPTELRIARDPDRKTHSAKDVT